MASRIPKMPSQVSHVAIAEETAAPSSKAQAAMAQAKKGIPKAPTSSASSAARPAPSRLQPFTRISTRLPAAPAAGNADAISKRQAGAGPGLSIRTSGADLAPSGGEPEPEPMCEALNCDDTVALQKPCTYPPPSSFTAGPQQPVEEQPCGCSGDKGPAATTSDTCASSDLLRSASSSSCGDCPSSSLSASSSSCSLSPSSSCVAAAIDSTSSSSPDSPSSTASDSPSSTASVAPCAACSSAKRPTSSLPSSSSQAEQEPRTAADDTVPHSCCCPAPPPTTAATPLAMTAQESSLARLEQIRQRLLKTCRPADELPDLPRHCKTLEERVADLRQRLRDSSFHNHNHSLPPNYDCTGPVLQAPAPLAPVTAVTKAVPVCASPRPSLTTETEKEEAPTAEATAQPSKAPKRKLSRFLRGLFGGCVGRNVEAL